MKKVFKSAVIAGIGASIICTAIAIINHSMSTAAPAKYLMLVAGIIGAAYSLFKFSAQMVGKIDHPEKKRADDMTPIHRGWPIWAFLGFFLIEVALAAACIYFATHMWSVRDLINFELTAIISAVVVYWFTHGLPGKKKA